MKKITVFLILVLLSGCTIPASLASQATPTLDQTKVAQAVQTSVSRATSTLPLTVTATPTSQPSFTPAPSSTTLPSPAPANTQTPTLDLTPQVSTTQQECIYSAEPGLEQPLPAAKELTWQAQTGPAGQWQVLSGFASPVVDVQPDFSGRWWAVKVIRSSGGPGPAETALYVLDGAGNGSWQASAGGTQFFHESDWTAEGRLVWVDNGKVFMADPNGANKLDLKAPEPVSEIWVGANNRAIASAQNGLWRVDLQQAAWTQVANLYGNVTFSSPASNLALSPDGSFAALATAVPSDITEGALWLVPLDPAQPARPILHFLYLGRGGRLFAPRPLAGGPYWFVADIHADPSQPDLAVSQFVNTSSGKIVPAANLVPPGTLLANAQVSPDGKWAALATYPQGQDSASTLWSISFAAGSDLKPLFSVPGDSIAGWRANPPAAWVIQPAASDQQAVNQVSLLDGKAVSLGQVQNQDLPLVILSTVKGALLLGQPALLFDLNGAPLGSFPPPVSFTEVTAASTSSSGGVFLAGVSTATNAAGCQYSFPVLLWVPGDLAK